MMSHRFQCEAQLTAGIALATEGIAFASVQSTYRVQKKECTSSASAADHCKISGLCRQNDDMCRKCKPEETAETPSRGSDVKELAVRAKHPAGGHRLSPWRPILSPFVAPRSLPCLFLSLFGLHTAELLAPAVEVLVVSLFLSVSVSVLLGALSLEKRRELRGD
jgi:hypothetical protein